MVELPHVLVGAAIAVKVSNPVLALPLVIVSHYVLDLVPHANPHIYTQIKKEGKIRGKTLFLIVLDSGVALLAGLLLALISLPDINKSLMIILGSFLAVLPDVLEIPYYFFQVRHPLMGSYVEFNHRLQASAPLIPGVITQILISLAALWWMFS